ncbi:hypothetical protein [Moraxella porci]|uniref:hypothetical protein n=1 Tax=Moraxella porci TaxID=1288392 RepID=UPI00244B59FE|nr:hypothetical protein [Moraxella porci]MDH2274423.1 hypothetical protein [Moraxella porci]
MKTKTILILSILLSSLTLTACDPFNGLRGYGQEAGANGKPAKGFKNARGGGNVWGCQKEIIPASDGGAYLEQYGLPREIGGNFICENGKPALPKDCQGREIRSEAELNAYTTKYQLPQGTIVYDCSTGVPKIPAEFMPMMKALEEEKPTCTDSRGRKRPCV